MATETTGGTEAAGMPQLEFSPFPNQIFWLVIALIAIYFILSRIAMPRIAAVLAERQGTITNDLAAAEELKLKAVEAEKAYEKAKAEIQADLDVELQKADAEIAAKTAESEKAIAAIRESASESVKEVAKDTAKELVSVLGGKADAKSVTAAVNARMKG